MKDAKVIARISQAILSYDNSGISAGFEKYMLATISGSADLDFFKTIWATAMEFENWNYQDLQTGYMKTIEILKNNHNLPEDVCRQLANAAAYQWK